MHNRRFIQYSWFLIQIALLGLWLVPWGLSWWLLLAYQTTAGLAIANVGLWGGVGFSLLLASQWWPKAKYGAMGAGLVVVIALVVWLGQVPSGRSASNSPITHQFVGDQRPFPRWSLANNLIPEAEQMNLGFQLMPYLDALFTVEQAAQLRPATAALYTQIGQDPHFSQLGSSMGWAYQELIGQPFDEGHYYLYVPPETRADESLPALVFLHGSGGNFLPYIWILAKVAKQERLIIIAPSFGFGNWRKAGGSTAVLNALADAQQKANIDPQNIYLMGLSNGGLGVSLVSHEAATQFAGLIFISPVMANEIVDSPAFHTQWHGRPVLVITGDIDDRIPLRYVRQRIERLEQGGVEVTSHIYTNHDHFLFFYAEERLQTDLATWLNKHRK